VPGWEAGGFRDREDPLAPANLSPEAFRQVNGVLLEGGAPVGGVVWSHGGIGAANDFFAIAMGAPLRDGQIRAVSGTFKGGGWGPFDVGGRAASFALCLGDAWATSVHGEFTVVEATPLSLEVVLDVTLSDGASARLVQAAHFAEELSLRGVAPVVSCLCTNVERRSPPGVGAPCPGLLPWPLDVHYRRGGRHASVEASVQADTSTAWHG